MNIKPVLLSLLHNRAGAILIALQVALTLAIVCNALFIIQQRLAYMNRPSGVDEDRLFVLSNLYVGAQEQLKLHEQITRDLAAVRGVAGVADAIWTNTFPLSDGGWAEALRADQDRKFPRIASALYLVDDHALATYGLKLEAGRNFTPDEVEVQSDPDAMPQASAVIVTRALAKQLYPDQDPIGKSVYLSDSTPRSTIIGVVERLQIPWVGFGWAYRNRDNAVLVPNAALSPSGKFVVRVVAGQDRDTVMRAVDDRLMQLSRMRVILQQRSFDEVRARIYASDRGLAIMMAVVCAVLLLFNAAGIVGLVNFWVGQRQRQIGIRRALGARRRDILAYFQIENLLISIGGVLFGMTAAIGLNLWLVTHYAMERLSFGWLLGGAAVVVLLGQFAVLQPARRASRVPPVVATRGS